MALLDYSNQLADGDEYQSLSVIGSQGAAYADDLHNQQLLYAGGHPRAIRADERARVLASIVQSFIDERRAGADGTASVQNWLRVLAVSQTIARSLASGRAVAVEGC
jgi:predicted dehydrogenase